MWEAVWFDDNTVTRNLNCLYTGDVFSFFRPRPLIWNRRAFSPTLEKFPPTRRVSFGLPFTVNSRLLRYLLVQTLSQVKFIWHQIRLKRRGIIKWKQHVQSFLSVWNKRLLSATARHACHAGKRPSEKFAVFLFRLFKEELSEF